MRFVKSFSALILVGILLLVVACGNATSATSVSQKPESKAATSVTPTPTIAASPTPIMPFTESTSAPVPTHLTIPAINIDAGIEPVGIKSDGSMGTPTQNIWENTGWYKYGARPGDKGSAVLDGHLDRTGGAPAVFWNLGNLHPGDKVIITNAKGQQLNFVVTQVVAYPPQQAPLEQIFGNTSGKYLNLITCAGDWIPSQHSYSVRLVVYTKAA